MSKKGWIEPTSWAVTAHGVEVTVNAGSEANGVVRVVVSLADGSKVKAVMLPSFEQVTTIVGWRDVAQEVAEEYATRVAQVRALDAEMLGLVDADPEAGKRIGQVAIDRGWPLQYQDMTPEHVDAWRAWIREQEQGGN